MSDNLEFLPQPEPQPENSLELPFTQQPAPLEQEETVTLELPVDILAALEQHVYQSGQTQTQAVLEVLRTALGLSQTTNSQVSPQDRPEISATNELTANSANATQTTTQTTLIALTKEVEQLKNRLHHLEALIPQVENLMGKSIAF